MSYCTLFLKENDFKEFLLFVKIVLSLRIESKFY